MVENVRKQPITKEKIEKLCQLFITAKDIDHDEYGQWNARVYIEEETIKLLGSGIDIYRFNVEKKTNNGRKLIYSARSLFQFVIKKTLDI